MKLLMPFPLFFAAIELALAVSLGGPNYKPTATITAVREGKFDWVLRNDKPVTFERWSDFEALEYQGGGAGREGGTMGSPGWGGRRLEPGQAWSGTTRIDSLLTSGYEDVKIEFVMRAEPLFRGPTMAVTSAPAEELIEAARARIC